MALAHSTTKTTHMKPNPEKKRFSKSQFFYNTIAFLIVLAGAFYLFAIEPLFGPITIFED